MSEWNNNQVSGDGSFGQNPYQDPRYQETGKRISVGQFWLQSIVFFIMIIIGIVLVFSAIQLHPDGGQGLFCVGVILLMFGFGGDFDIIKKRFHDLNLSGAMILTLLIPGVNIVPCIMLLFIPGTNGPNNYGQKP